MANGQIENEKNMLPVAGKKLLKFLFVSQESLSGDLALHIKKEGHEVKAYIKAETDKDVYDGFLDKVPDWKEHIDWADVIIFDDVGFGHEADELRAKGKLVVGGS
ncbi:MAG: phosphoribosylamine--glycine ligase, partial [Candidatus Staskawiczbacteria bacterium]